MANLLRERWSELNSGQKMAVTALSICCAFLLIGGISQLRSNVRKPFLVSRQKLAQAIQIRTQNFESTEKQVQELKLKDTDRDGISDYDEQYVYRTSSYLADSDSDGLSDAEEIANNEDPNCPKGKDCLDVQSAVAQTATSTFVTAADASLAATQAKANAATQTGVEGFIANPKPPESMNAEQTRAYIRQQSLLPEDQLVNLSDEALLQAYQMSYQEALRIQAARAAVAGGGSATTSAPISPSPSTPTP